MALDMRAETVAMTANLPFAVDIRIGFHLGPVVAGVIGAQKPFYDVWGETVNTASRLESHGEVGKIQVTETAQQELTGDYTFESRGKVDIKGIGQLYTWWLIGRE